MSKATYIKILHDTFGDSYHEPVQFGEWYETATHTISGFVVVNKKDYFDITVPFLPSPEKPYFLLYTTYSTGDSFGYSYNGSIEFIDLYAYEELDLAKENKKRIEDHNEVKSSNFNEEYYFYLLDREGQEHRMSAPWKGYFENLESVNIDSVWRRPQLE